MIRLRPQTYGVERTLYPIRPFPDRVIPSRMPGSRQGEGARGCGRTGAGKSARLPSQDVIVARLVKEVAEQGQLTFFRGFF